MPFKFLPAAALRSRRRLALSASLLLLVAACAAPPTPSAPGTKASAPKSQPAVEQPKAPQPAPLAEPEPPAASPAPPAKPPVDVRKLIESVRGHLNQGQEDDALSELNQVLEAEPDNKAAQHYLRQIKEDPVVRYGRASQPYRVEPNDTMASLAARFLGDSTQFYGLARYAGVKAPGDLKVGQVLKVPSRRVVISEAPATGSTAPTASAPSGAAEARAKAEAEARQRDEEQKKAEAQRAADERKAAEKKKADIDALVKRGNTAMASQNLCGAIKIWNQVLELDPQHSAAKYERDKALKMQAALPARKC